MTPIKVFIACSGLGRVNRGYESFAQELFSTFVDDPAFDLTLFKGGGTSRVRGREIVLWNIPRDSALLAMFCRGEELNRYYWEQRSFTLSFLPYILRHKPQVVLVSDYVMGRTLWRLRRIIKQDFRLLLSNGGPMPPPFPEFDHVHQVAPTHYKDALAAGDPAEKQTLLPYAIRMRDALGALTLGERGTLRTKRGLPADRPIILSVGAVNLRHKRMDYLVREVASLPKPRPFLLLLGQQDGETPQVRALADELLGADDYAIRTAPQNEVPDYYAASDVFVLASLAEGLPRVVPEAMSHGLPCLVHDYELMRFVLGEDGYFGDFTATGSLACLLRSVLGEGYDVHARERRFHAAYQRYSWQHLREHYAAMIRKCAAST